MDIYYVYAYLRKTDSTPYYIGKGKDKRAYSKNHGKIKVPEDKNRIVFLETNLTEIGAYALERFYIRWYGRKDNDTGILRNMTDGGDGVSNRNITSSTKKKLSRARKGKFWVHNPNTNENFLLDHLPIGYVLGMSPTSKNKISNCSGTKWFYDPLTNKQIRAKICPPGYITGLTESHKRNNARGIGKHWFYCPTTDVEILSYQRPPDYLPGRLKRSR